MRVTATPPAVGSCEAIDQRTVPYFGFLLVSAVAAVLATLAAVRLRERIGTYAADVLAAQRRELVASM